MVDSSWDNSGLPPQKQGLGRGMKVLMGCGIAALLALLTCTIGGAILSNMIKKDPKGFETRVEGFAKGFVQKDWDRFRALVDQLQTDDGARLVYRANPALHEGHPSEDQFLQTVRAWRPRLTPLPVAAPVGKQSHRRQGQDEPDGPKDGPARDLSVDITKVFGTTTIACRYPGGARLSVTFDGDRVERIGLD